MQRSRLCVALLLLVAPTLLAGCGKMKFNVIVPKPS